ncbi:MAG: HIT domain-containing protein [Candidatus Micrarchaeaceae archaeon]
MECIFCEIVYGGLKHYKIYEDRNYIGILDIFPNIKGQSLVIPKRHISSYAFDLDDFTLSEFMSSVKRVAKILEKGLMVKRVHMVLEGTEVDHLHAKLYPAIGFTNSNIVVSGEEKFESYPGYITTMHGPKASDTELEKLRDEILKKASIT